MFYTFSDSSRLSRLAPLLLATSKSRCWIRVWFWAWDLSNFFLKDSCLNWLSNCEVFKSKTYYCKAATSRSKNYFRILETPYRLEILVRGLLPVGVFTLLDRDLLATLLSFLEGVLLAASLLISLLRGRRYD
jgi:hypothetical protein